jgi:hypothetical protein
MRDFDFSSWQTVLSTFVGLALITLIGVGICLLVMQTVQQRRERENRQINERLRALIAAYKTLGGSFTGDLAVDPAHLRELLRRQPLPADVEGNDGAEPELRSSERSRRIRDAVEAALSDVILLGTEDQCGWPQRRRPISWRGGPYTRTSSLCRSGISSDRCWISTPCPRSC